MARVETTVFEISGPDRPGLLDDVVNLLALNGCDVRSAAVWTYRRRSAFVLSVTEKGAAVTNAVKLARLRQLMREIIGHDSARVACKQVRGEVHHDRRLHQQMLLEEVEAWKAGRSRGLTDSDSDVSESTTVACAPVADTDEDDAGPGAVVGSKGARPGAIPVPVPSGGRDTADVRVDGSPISVSSSAGMGMAGTMRDHVSSGDALRSPKYDRPEVDVSYDHSSCYWVVTVLCRNRNKLLFDTACTLADLEYDIWHATIESLPDGMYSQEYYVRPRDGDAAFDEERAALLRAMLYSSIRRRFPRGLKLHVHSLDRYGSLAELTRVLRSTGLTITRAKVRTYATSRSAGHTFYVMDASGRPPNKEAVERACRKVGGNLVEAGKESFSASLGSHRFSFSFLRTEGARGRRTGSRANADGNDEVPRAASAWREGTERGALAWRVDATGFARGVRSAVESPVAPPCGLARRLWFGADRSSPRVSHCASLFSPLSPAGSSHSSYGSL